MKFFVYRGLLFFRFSGSIVELYVGLIDLAAIFAHYLRSNCQPLPPVTDFVKSDLIEPGFDRLV